MMGWTVASRLWAIGGALLIAIPVYAADQPANQSATPGGGPKKEPNKEAPKALPANPAPPPHVMTPKEQADSVLGKEVYGADGQMMGLVTNVLIDRQGHPIALVIDFGGFLGVGSRKIAIDWHLMQFHPGDKKKPVTLSLSKDQLKAAPEYRPEKSSTPIVKAPPPQDSTEAQPRNPAPTTEPSPGQKHGSQ